MYTSDTEDTKRDEDVGEKDVAYSDDTGKMRHILIKIMSSQTSLGVDYGGSSIRSDNRLLEEIELFPQSLMEVDDR